MDSFPDFMLNSMSRHPVIMIFDTKTHAKTELILRRAAVELSRADMVMGSLIEQIGRCELSLARRRHYFRALVEAIIYQQLAGKAAAAILSRFRALYPSGRFPAAQEIADTPERLLRSAGLSPQKISYIRDLSGRVLDGSFHLRSLASMEDEAVVEHLTQVKGIGRWTAEMFLIFTLGRSDVLPLNDLGILKAVQQAYGFSRLPEARTLERMGRKWRPHRSVASWYLWASVDGK
jgi:DNA-3-methyladenine glycosylase II